MAKTAKTSDPIAKRWAGAVIVAAPGPSLTLEVAELCRGYPCIAVNDAYRLLPWAEVLYAGDWRWWDVHNGCPKFQGEKIIPSARVWSSAEAARVVAAHKLRVVDGLSTDTFSLDPARIHYGIIGTGANSGFQAINLAILFGGNPIILVGMDMRMVDNKRHFFGDHPRPLMKQQMFGGWIRNISNAAKRMPTDLRIINATPGSALKCFPIMTPEEALRGHNGTVVSDAA